ncbi:MAG TPA: hypothetical protein VJN70_01855 [Gemmatimonadaceae bacterium]|nr:hypothetical protein [Gemmatimonadaceae bacterium]
MLLGAICSPLANLDLFSLDEWEKYNRETIEIRKMTYTYRRKVVETAQNE